MADTMITRNRTITPLAGREEWTVAFRRLSDHGGLPPNALHDSVLSRLHGFKQLDSYYPAWAREVLVYPEMGGVFAGGKDIVADCGIARDKRLVLPSSCVPREAVNTHGVGLLLIPQDIHVQQDKIIIQPDPKSVKVLYPFIQASGMPGAIENEARIPLSTLPEAIEEIPAEQKRWFMREVTQSITPIVRGPSLLGGWRALYAVNWINGKFGVGEVGGLLTQEGELSRFAMLSKMRRR